LPAQKLRVIHLTTYALAAIDASLELSSEARRHGEGHPSNAISICDLVPSSKKPAPEAFERGDLNLLCGHRSIVARSRSRSPLDRPLSQLSACLRTGELGGREAFPPALHATS
jgi:hypothetical protein